MAGLKALFNPAAIQNFLRERIEAANEKVFESLQYSGEEFVNKARLKLAYKDQTGNLRSSIGYIILKDGKVVDKSFELSEKGTDRRSGLKKAKEFTGELISQFPKGYVLIGVAGMNYAAAVENMGYDVITGSAPQDNEIKDLLSAIKF